ncbi:MAG: SDR family oxidoreductase [Mycobacterium kyogaense]|uniref:SDR family oxidoreductase n=1 Tax=Mycobacterium kyogaense TaxID=2212479 RepID=UPI002FF76516
MATPEHAAVPTMTGRLIMITGGSDGIGLALADRLAAAGAELILPVRNADKGRRAVDRIRITTPQARVTLKALDLSSLQSVADLAGECISEGRPIHVLINNAGVMSPPSRQTTADGFELQWGSNHLGHFALTARLLPLLAAGQARVTTQTSVSARFNGINWADLDFESSYSESKAYSQSKIANLMFALELNRRSELNGWGITSNASHPGVTPTNLLAAQPVLGRERDTPGLRAVRVAARLGLVNRSADEGMLPALHAATHPAARGGKLYGPKGFQHLSGPPAEQEVYKPARDAAEAARLWELSEQLVGVRFDHTPASPHPKP